MATGPGPAGGVGHVPETLLALDGALAAWFTALAVTCAAEGPVTLLDLDGALALKAGPAAGAAAGIVKLPGEGLAAGGTGPANKVALDVLPPAAWCPCKWTAWRGGVGQGA